MRRFLVLTSAVLLTTSCSHVRGATSLTPQAAPESGVWVFIESDNASKTGVYRCTGSATDPVCVKADTK